MLYIVKPITHFVKFLISYNSTSNFDLLLAAILLTCQREKCENYCRTSIFHFTGSVFGDRALVVPVRNLVLVKSQGRGLRNSRKSTVCK